jgi:hypothetical protein
MIDNYSQSLPSTMYFEAMCRRFSLIQAHLPPAPNINCDIDERWMVCASFVNLYGFFFNLGNEKGCYQALLAASQYVTEEYEGFEEIVVNLGLDLKNKEEAIRIIRERIEEQSILTIQVKLKDLSSKQGRIARSRSRSGDSSVSDAGRQDLREKENLP